MSPYQQLELLTQGRMDPLISTVHANMWLKTSEHSTVLLMTGFTMNNWPFHHLCRLPQWQNSWYQAGVRCKAAAECIITQNLHGGLHTSFMFDCTAKLLKSYVLLKYVHICFVPSFSWIWTIKQLSIWVMFHYFYRQFQTYAAFLR